MEPQSSHFSKEKTGLSPGKKSKHTPLSVPLNVVRTLDQMQGAATWKWAQTKTTMNYHITCWKGHYQKVKKKKNNKYGEDVEKREPLHTVGCNVN
jgi:hypothetical protein